MNISSSGIAVKDFSELCPGAIFELGGRFYLRAGAPTASLAVDLESGEIREFNVPGATASSRNPSVCHYPEARLAQ